jgi:hypothetical protein
MFFLLIRSTQKKQRVPKVSKRVCPYIHVWCPYIHVWCPYIHVWCPYIHVWCPYIHVWVYIIYFLFVLMHTLRQSLSETYIALLCNYYFFYIKKVPKMRKFQMFNFYIFHPILMQFFAK